MFIQLLGEFGALLFMALALSVDGFSVSLGIGLHHIRLKRIIMIGFAFGFFHILLPFLGVIIGQFISLRLEYITSIIAGFILVIIGLHMIFSALQTKTYFMINPKGFQLLTIAILVSIDSFPVGVSLGLYGIKTIFIIFLFGISAMVLAWTGMLLGRKAHSLLGTYSEVFGGLILLIFGLSSIFY